ncbi:type I restriction endonuclease subunit R [Myroides marinus]|uniref:type I restriction endonuclease subunit R n=1 Tax=Myroides marinus TaxID=703342 RepID=UPI0025776B88|nr:type I restriction endonuclease subunit R [Myroides marinus]MDM1350689.1 type I restriction endonuclease subunit R [Myroides marinus]MDM1357896.1 type I restriction endonuclease subunit R [Myroides marinus]MDM1365982.1 type I restriction endonuclease subunit R [Myroides marinus]
MKSQTNELALETAIEKALCGISTEDIKNGITAEPTEAYGGQGYQIGYPADFNPKYALDEARFWNFLANTQKDELEKLQRQSDWKIKILDRYDKLVKKYGILRLLRKGLAVDDAHFTLFYVAPLQNSSQQIKDNFEQNQFSVTRQLRYSASNPLEEIDMVIFINGIPISTIELKNHWTGQNAKVHGINQYKFKRDTTQPLLNFGRCIVHFAIDTDEIYMTTKLDGAKTFFLPFNLGENYGKGNPTNPFGHKTTYFWQDILKRESIANIIQHFVRFDGGENDALSKKTLFFPRYHQLDVVRRLLKDTAQNGAGKTYLIQHSAGSGKSNSITWLAYQLIEAYPENDEVAGNKSVNQPLFDSVIVVTDRRLLDKQLRDNIKEFSEVKNIVAPAYKSSDLKSALENGKRIIITTIQKFPFIIDDIADMSNKQFAVIIDEAHSSQSGTSADKLNEAIGNKGDEADSEDYQDMMLQAMHARKMTQNASYFAFTATPKNATLEKFGVKQEDGSFKPFHLYSMKQAIEEGFILDVLANYTTYKSYYELEKSIEDNPLFDTSKAQKKLKAYVEKHQQTIGTKAEIMLNHFTSAVVNQKKLNGKAKAMVVTQSIESAIRYYQALSQLLAKRGNPFKIVIAFSGEKEIGGIKYTEAQMNGFSESETKDKFDEDEYRMLVVANKYLTGFDQPKLSAMYVDKKLQGVLAVQTLSRLNRSANKLNKKTEDLFVLDFFNAIEDIQKSFNPFYTATSLSGATDINVLHELKDSLDDSGIYEQSEVDDFNEKYFKGTDAQLLSPIIDIATKRFADELDLDDKQKADYKIKAKQFVKIYGQVAAILPYEILAWEKLFWFLKFLIPKMVVKDSQADLLDELLESVDLSTYGLERTKLNVSIPLDDEETELSPQNPNARGAHGEEEKDELEAIINGFNERWFQGWEATPDDQRVKFLSLSKSVQSHPDFDSKVAQNVDNQNRELALKKILDDVMAQQRKQELELYKLYAQDSSFYQAFYNTIKRVIDL